MNIVKNNFIVITGGPGGGKSTLLAALADKGVGCIEEAARQVIKDRLSRNLPARPGAAAFAQQIFEIDVKNYLANVNSEETIFFDRSFLDSACMLCQADKIYFEKEKHFLQSHRFYPKVLITPPWQEIYCNDSERDQTLEQAIEVYETLYNWYKSNGYEPIVLPKASVQERVNFVLDLIPAINNSAKK